MFFYDYLLNEDYFLDYKYISADENYPLPPRPARELRSPFLQRPLTVHPGLSDDVPRAPSEQLHPHLVELHKSYLPSIEHVEFRKKFRVILNMKRKTTLDFKNKIKKWNYIVDQGRTDLNATSSLKLDYRPHGHTQLTYNYV
ncbi:hypothetical protein CDAR_494811 [Caerostris darwini]|uniref:Uncharacterized protein n=1 Tax=Caerostris darwini TaxID=1538125 RepID=A0AAV4MJ22_9ARAC|nr:hypothetical protein CDAR_494811 [Caerostris darwini]